MELQCREPPDKGVWGSKEGGVPSLPSSLAAAVKASQQESRETQPAGGQQPGEEVVGTEPAAAAKVFMQAGGQGGAQGGLPLESPVSVVLTGHGGSKGEGSSPRGNQPGDKTAEGNTEAARSCPQVEEGLGRTWAAIVAEKELDREVQVNFDEVEEEFSLSSWEKRKQRGKRLEQKGVQQKSQGEQEDENGRRNTTQMRDGDWRCVVEECRGEVNFARSRQCWKCGAGKDGNRRSPVGRGPPSPDPRRGGMNTVAGNQGAELSPTDRLKRRVEEQRGPLRRQPRMILLTVNITIDGKTQVKPAARDHYDIIRQTGLDKEEVKGVVAKPGYLEVALPGAVSVAGALRETSKEVNSKIVITSVKEKGASRVVVIKWQEVSLDTLLPAVPCRGSPSNRPAVDDLT